MQVPAHVAVLPDGDRRWAKAHNLPVLEGHRAGAVSRIIDCAGELGIHTLSFWGFSTENWKRSAEDVTHLMRLFETYALDPNIKKAKASNTRIIHLGRKDRLPRSLLDKIARAEEDTKGYTDHILNLALDYGGHDEILRAVTAYSLDVAEGRIGKDVQCTEELFSRYLDTKDQPHPYPDLIIRTGGEQRLSGFMAWQSAYSEFYFAKEYMPDFTPDCFRKAIEDFAGRDRRFGGNSTKS